jgi:hypothetical protein
LDWDYCPTAGVPSEMDVVGVLKNGFIGVSWAYATFDPKVSFYDSSVGDGDLVSPQEAFEA